VNSNKFWGYSMIDNTQPTSNGTVESLLTEQRVFRPLPRVIADSAVNPADLKHAYHKASVDSLAYWEDAAERLQWYRRWDTVLNDTDAPFYKWFFGARCNIVHNALDRHITSPNRNKLALIWEGEPGDTKRLTYFELYREVNKCANAMRELGVTKGDTVVIYLPSLPETVISMLAAAKIGAIHSVVFAGFSANALAERIEDAKPKIIITVDAFYRNGRILTLKPLVDEALEQVEHTVDHTIVVHRTHVTVEMDAEKDLWWHDVMRGKSYEAITESMDATDPLFMLYTSGTTDKPKGVVHSHGGYMVGVHQTFTQVFDNNATDIFWCTADVGWITGHSYVVYGPLMAGTTTFMYEGHPLYPEAGRLWSVVERWGISVLYTVPTLIRMLMRFGEKYALRHDLSTLRLLGTVGEPISPEAWVWFHKHIGKGQCPLLDTWWQTETGMIMISPYPISVLKPGSVARPLPAVDIDIVDDDGTPVPTGKGGYLIIKKPWPAMITTLFNDEETYKEMYWSRFPGYYCSGDIARKDEDGYIWLQGRADDVIMIAGHRIGTAEFEAALSSHPLVAECAVIGMPDSIRGEVAKAYVVLKEQSDTLYFMDEEDETEQQLIGHVRAELGSIAVIGSVDIRDALPRNRSGKIMRRLLRAEITGGDRGDTSTLEEDPFWATIK
jgi:acetyl-CoA synthetase